MCINTSSSRTQHQDHSIPTAACQLPAIFLPISLLNCCGSSKENFILHSSSLKHTLILTLHCFFFENKNWSITISHHASGCWSMKHIIIKLRIKCHSNCQLGFTKVCQTFALKKWCQLFYKYICWVSIFQLLQLSHWLHHYSETQQLFEAWHYPHRSSWTLTSRLTALTNGNHWVGGDRLKAFGLSYVYFPCAALL